MPLRVGFSLSLKLVMTTHSIDTIAEKILAGGRIDRDEAEVLWREAPLSLLGRLASEMKRRKSGDAVYYNRNFHIEPTNICVFNCRFCSYRRGAGDPSAWNHSLAEIEQIVEARKNSGVTEVHIVGGVHPDHDIQFYAEMIRIVKRILPDVAVKAYTAIELAYMIDKAGMSYEEGLMLLRDAGMQAIPGGGAEIFDEELRSQICPEKGDAKVWLSLHRAAHRLGIRSNATMLYGHIETIPQRIDHLDRLRTLQDETGGFDAFIPLKFRRSGNRLGEGREEVPVTEDMRTLAMSRLYLDNFPHIKAYWVMYGKQTAEMALGFGADDMDGTIDDSTKIYSMAGAEQKPRLTVEDMKAMAASAGLRAVERDTFYREVVR